jgi:hypothetical protein
VSTFAYALCMPAQLIDIATQRRWRMHSLKAIGSAATSNAHFSSLSLRAAYTLIETEKNSSRLIVREARCAAVAFLMNCVQLYILLLERICLLRDAVAKASVDQLCAGNGMIIMIPLCVCLRRHFCSCKMPHCRMQIALKL